MLGEPTSTSINSGGLRKWINYEQWNVAYEISEGDADDRCMIKSSLSYRDESGELPEETPE